MESIVVFLVFLAISIFLRRGKEGGGQIEVSGMRMSDGFEYNHIINVNCPHCKTTLSIPEEGDWVCYKCDEPFIYYKRQVYRGEENHSIISIYLIALLAKFSKIDGVVTQEDLKIVSNSMCHLMGFDDDKKMLGLKKIFNEEIKSPNNYEELLERIYRFCNKNTQIQRDVKIFLIDTMFKIATIDGKIENIHEKHNEIIFKTVQIFNIDHMTYEKIKEKYISGLITSNGYKSFDYYCKVLELSNDPTLAEVKESYRRLSKKYHPDIYAAKDLPQEIIDLTAEKFREINEAYEVLVNKLSS